MRSSRSNEQDYGYDYTPSSQQYDDKLAKEQDMGKNPEDMFQIINRFFDHEKKTKAFLLVALYNSEINQEIMGLGLSEIRDPKKREDFAKLKPQIDKYIKNKLSDKELKSLLNREKENAEKKFRQDMEKIEFDSNLLLPCLQKQIGNKTAAITTGLNKLLTQRCQGGPKMVSLHIQLKQLMNILLDHVTPQQPEIQKIMQSKSFESIYLISIVTRAEAERFENYGKCLKSFQELVKYGTSLSESQNAFITAIASQICKVCRDEKQIIQLINNFNQNPLYDFSNRNDLTDGTKTHFYNTIYQLKQYQELLKLKNIPNSLKTKSQLQIELILKKLSKDAEKQVLRQYLNKYEFQKFYHHHDVGTGKMKNIYQFIEQNCPNYQKYRSQQNNCTDQTKPTLIIQLRKKLLQLAIPFSLHTKIEQLVMNRKLYQILGVGLTNDKKMQIFNWINLNLSQYYKIEFNSTSLREETKEKIIEILIKLDLNFTYKNISLIANQFLEKIDEKKLYGNDLLRKDQKKAVKEAFKNCKKVKQYEESLGLDMNVLRFNAENTLIYDIILPNGFGFLDADLIKNFVQQYLQKPDQDTIQKSDLPISHKKRLIQKMKKNKHLEQYTKSIKRLTSQKNIKIFHDYVEKQLDSDLAQKVWKLFQTQGRIILDQNGHLVSEDPAVEQINAEISEDTIESLKELIQCEKYHNFKYEFPNLIKKKYKQTQQSLSQAIDQKLQKSKLQQDEIATFLEALKNANFNAETLKSNKAFKKPSDTVIKMTEYKQYWQLRQSSQAETQFLQTIQLEKDIKRILQGRDFNKYSEDIKKKVIDMYRTHGKSFISQLQGQILNEDLNTLKEAIGQKQQKEETITNVSPSKLSANKVKELVSPKNSSQKAAFESPIKLMKKATTSKKVLEPSAWKQSLSQKYKKTIDQMLVDQSQLQTLKSQLKTYEKKTDLITQVKSFLEQQKSSSFKQLIEKMKDDRQSIIKELDAFKKIQVNPEQFLTDFQFGNAGALTPELKTKYSIKANAKFNGIKDEIKKHNELVKKSQSGLKMLKNLKSIEDQV